MIPIREYRWSFDTTEQGSLGSPEFLGKAKGLADKLTISPVLAEILVKRGIDTFEKAKEFFRPSLDSLLDPFLMDGMSAAVDRISSALQKKERILVYGDYDVDGTNGTSLLWLFLHRLGADVLRYIPERLKEGYGLSSVGIDFAKQHGVTLMITVDCGVTAIEKIRYAKTNGIDVIVCDHHETGDNVPDAVAVLDPLKSGCNYPFKYLCGAGVALKLVQALCKPEIVQTMYGGDPTDTLSSYLEFVALATTADIVPLVGENRTMTKLGLDLINSNPSPGIRALIETSGLELGRISAGQVVFVLAPRINAVGRLGDAMRAVELLTCQNYDQAMQLARVFEEENRNRRKIDEDTFLEAQQIVENYLNIENDNAIILHQETWHPGVIGIVASRLVERYYRPTIMMTTVDGIAKGSARSVAGFDIYQALKRCEDKLLQFGGHKYAAGLSVDVERLEEFKEAFHSVARELLNAELLTPELRIDAEIDLAELTPKFVRILAQFAPFGPQNMRPVFVSRNVELVGQPRIVGNNHLRFKVRKNNRVLDAIGFNLGGFLEKVQSRRTLDIAFSIDESEFAGELIPQLKIRDLKFS
ncbi:MAG TPA: single-stranded-DNA-specific exonuclease RecJ [Bacteroidota bacterium]|nr:single-stranded-DNA-specific exonuclease RecJ [Bacteroidota bacterium]